MHILINSLFLKDDDEFDEIDHSCKQQTCRAIYEYIPKQGDELALKEGLSNDFLLYYSIDKVK